MKKWKFPAAIAIIMVTAFACSKVEGTGPVVRQTMSTGQFQKLSLEIPATLFYSPSNSFKVELEAQQNILNVLRAEVRNNTLFLSVRENTSINTRKDINIYIEAPDLNSLQLQGNANIVVMKPYEPAQLYLGINGNGSIAIPRLETNKILADISGSGMLSIDNGVAVTADIDIAGSGFADWENLTTDSLTSRITGSAVLRVSANRYIKTEISGSGSLYYRGNPQIESVVSGTGKIVKL